MSQQACPHCGFMNFSISAYCGRCERPLRQNTGASRPPISRTPPPPAPNQRTALGTPPPAATTGRATIPVPPPPLPLPFIGTSSDTQLSLNTAAKTPVPAKTPPTFIAKALEQPAFIPAANPLFLPSALRVFSAQFCDLLLACVVASAIMAIEALFFATSPGAGRDGFENFALWVGANFDIVTHAGAVAVIFGMVYNVVMSMRGGQTLGRRLFKLRLIRKNGLTAELAFLLVRSFGSLLSLFFLGLGYFWVWVDPYNRTWHDVLAGTLPAALTKPAAL